MNGGDGANWYAYCANNPLAFVDPSGLRDKTIVDHILCLLIGEENWQREFGDELYGEFAKTGDRIISLGAAISPADSFQDAQILITGKNWTGDEDSRVFAAAAIIIPGVGGPALKQLFKKSNDALQVIKNSIKGRAFEKAGINLLAASDNRILKNTLTIDDHIVDVFFGATKKIDGKNVIESVETMVEFKNVKYLSDTKQLSTFIKQGGDKFSLIINESTELSKPLIDKLENAGSSVYKMIEDNGNLSMQLVEDLSTLAKVK